jgi:hypothetical protein
MKTTATYLAWLSVLTCDLLLGSSELQAAGVKYLYRINLNSARGIALDNSERIYVRTPSHGVAVMDYSGNVEFQLGRNDPTHEIGNGDGEFWSPIGIDVDSNGKIHVADTGNNRIQVFNDTGDFLFKFGTTGAGPGQFDTVTGVAVGGTGKIYATDRNNKRVQIFDPFGNYQNEFPVDASGNCDPFSIALDNTNNVYVGDLLHDRVRVFDESGIPLFDFGGFATPEALTVDAVGKIYVVNSRPAVYTVRVFDPGGLFLFEFGGDGDGNGFLYLRGESSLTRMVGSSLPTTTTASKFSFQFRSRRH